MLTKRAIDHLDKNYKYTGNKLDRVLATVVLKDVLPFQGTEKLSPDNITKYFKQRGINISKDSRGLFYYNRVDAGELRDNFQKDKLERIREIILSFYSDATVTRLHADNIIGRIGVYYGVKYVDVATVCRQLGFSIRRNIITFRKG